jgi:hypothetical protein
VQAGLWEPLDDYLTPEIMDNWMVGVKENLTFYGRIYGVPGFLNPSMACFSKTALEKHGGDGVLEAIGPDRDRFDFDMMVEYGKEFGDGETRFFYGLPIDSTHNWGFGTWLEMWGVHVWDETEERWIAHEHPNSVKALQWYLDALYDWKIMIPKMAGWGDVDNFYWSLNCAWRNQWPGIHAELATAQAAGQAPAEFEIVLAGYPTLPEVKPFAAGLKGPEYTVGRTDDLDKREASFLFANWLGSDDSNAPGWLVNGYFPATKSGAKAVKDEPAMQNPNWPWVLDVYLQKFEAEFPGENTKPVRNPRTARIFNELRPRDYYHGMFQSLFLLERTPEQMLQEMAEHINGALGAEV